MRECKRCQKNWENKVENPKFCPKCHSPYWRIPRLGSWRFMGGGGG